MIEEIEEKSNGGPKKQTFGHTESLAFRIVIRVNKLECVQGAS